jgi:hypothetical protein
LGSISHLYPLCFSFYFCIWDDVACNHSCSLDFYAIMYMGFSLLGFSLHA